MPENTQHHKAGLTKENFFNDLQKKYPAGVQAFCAWIDEYKKAVEWTKLFNDGIREYQYFKGPSKFTQAPKFHDLPAAMQEGIYWAFIRDRGGCTLEIDDMFTFDFVKHFTETIIMLQKESEYAD